MKVSWFGKAPNRNGLEILAWIGAKLHLFMSGIIFIFTIFILIIFFLNIFLTKKIAEKNNLGKNKIQKQINYWQNLISQNPTYRDAYLKLFSLSNDETFLQKAKQVDPNLELVPE